MEDFSEFIKSIQPLWNMSFEVQFPELKSHFPVLIIFPITLIIFTNFAVPQSPYLGSGDSGNTYLTGLLSDFLAHIKVLDKH